MINILNQIAKRAKKLLLLLIIIPLVTGVVSYYLESKKPTTYIATASIELGNFDNETLADPVVVEELLKTDDYLTQIKEITNGEFNNADIKSRFDVTAPSPTDKKLLKFQYSGTDKKEVELTLHDLAEGFENIRNVDYQRKITNQEKNIALLESIETVDPKYVEVNFAINNIIYKETKASNSAEAIATYSNPLKRALFGIILGLMLNVVILVTPELFREYR